jgi:hypothetical protein
MSRAGQLETERESLRRQLAEWLDPVMTILGLLTLVLLLVEFGANLTPSQAAWVNAAELAIWAIFVLEFAAQLLLARDKPACLRSNWLTAIAVLVPALRDPVAGQGISDAFRDAELRRPAAARAWLLRILSNVCLSELRRPEAEPRADTTCGALEIGAAMSAFERTGNQALLQDAFANDLRFRLADRVDHQGLDLFATLLAADFEAGVRARPIRLIGGADVAIVEVWLDSRAEQPLHCPPALTQIHFHDGYTTQRATSHYAPRP